MLLVACVAAALWMFLGNADGRLVGNANVVGGLMGVASFAAVAVAFWPKRAVFVDEGSRATEEQLQAAAAYLARETLAYWREQAKARRITTPAPARVSWRWAGLNVAPPPAEVVGAESALVLLTDRVVSELRRDLYEVLPDPGRMVILGGPGAGKTTAMLLLLIDVLTRRAELAAAGRVSEAAGPVPVWLTLGGWNPREVALLEHAATVINRDYAGVVVYGGPSTAMDLLQAGQIALFLDGLDEMPDDLRGPALGAIDKAASGVRVVVTSRPAEFQSGSAFHRLWDAAIIDIQPVDLEHACEFLLEQQIGARRLAWLQVTDHMRRRPDSVVAMTLRNPLALSLARDTYTHTSANPADLLSHTTADALLRYLLARLLVIAYPDHKEYEHNVYWLTWIAERLCGDRDIRWWRMPSWTTRGSRLNWIDSLVVVLLSLGGTGLLLPLSGLSIPLLNEPRPRPTNWLQFGLVGLTSMGLMGAILVWMGSIIRLRGPSVLIWRRPKREEIGRIAGIALTAGFFLAIVTWVFYGFLIGFVRGLVPGLAFGVVGVLICLVILVLNLSTRPLSGAKVASPSEIRSGDLRRTIGCGIACALTFGLAFGSLLGIGGGDGIAFGLTFGLAIGLTLGLVSGLAFGLGPAVRMAVLELAFALRGTPVRLISVLETAVSRQVLRQAGAVYQFRHAAVQDLLAPPAPPCDGTGTRIRSRR
ncbi:NACHT domain-containing protein [Actinoplanes sp. NPDC051343]|uniref:NACHT domain-containing protein n=1 Tax=Actinoplanes sp. NPDC051343 TaxID=3363906 RepID=UPI0037B4DA61